MSDELLMHDETQDVVALLIDNEKELTEQDFKKLLVIEQSLYQRPEVIHTIERCIKRKGFGKEKEEKA